MLASKVRTLANDMTASRSSRYEYDSLFFDYIEEGAVRSAREIAPIVVRALGARSVLDVGCGAGAWLREYKRLGLKVVGIDGDYVDRRRLLVAEHDFVPLDLTTSFDLLQKFDLVQCLEVAEHLPPGASGTLVKNLIRHGDHVLFSAAVPGQGGEHHVNEQPCEFWRSLFAEAGFVPFDFLRPRLEGSRVESWYAQNTLLYARESASETLPAEVRSARVPEGAAIPDLAPPSMRLRRLVLRHLPVSVVSALAVLKHRIEVLRSRRRG